MPKKQVDSNMDDPKEFAAWAFAAGIPDPRYKSVTFNSIVPAPCFPAISEMLWDFGFRHHPELQTKWVNGYSGGDRNIVPVGLTDTDPDAVDSSNVVEYAAEMVADQFPDVADRIRQMNPENRDEMIRDQAQELLKSVQKLQKATGNLDKAWGGGSV